MDTALANLDVRASMVHATALQHGTLSGRMVRILRGVRWATSLVLAPEHLMRIFGGHDQLFGTPTRDTLISIPIETPTHVAAHIVVDFEANAAYPLLLDPFLLVDGRLEWQSADEEPPWDDE